MSSLLWILVLIASVWAAHWGSDKIAEPLQKMRRQWGLTEAAGAAFVALATASPEIGTNTVSAVRGLSDIGLGNLLGSNIISVPAIVTVAYIASASNGKKKANLLDISPEPLQVKPAALRVQAIPYVLIIALAALLTLPQPWRGLQPIDAWIMLAAYGIYLTVGILHKRQEGSQVDWKSREIKIAIAGVILLIIGAYFTVTATENLVSIFGISQTVGGLFITATLSIVPEVFATWNVAKSGQITAATTSVIADNTATMTLAFFPLALVSLPIQHLLLYSVNLMFVALLGVVYAAFIYWGKPQHSFSLKEIIGLNAVYVVYLCVMVFGVLKVI